ncbi:MAG: WYL domain-containing protein, partial [Solirubrobacterales bacterium]
SPERSRWLREERNVVEELNDGSVVVELPYAGTSWLVREILRGAGDLVVLDPPEAREAISRELAV